MPDVVATGRPLLAVIPDVELIEVGMNWPLAADGKEDGTFTPEDCAAAIAALDDPSIRAPKIIFGHRPVPPGQASPQPAAAFGPGSPVWGGATNLRSRNEGNTLVGDLTGVPAWLAEVMPFAWPSRSIQGRRNVVSETGRTHALVIDFISLLGVELPAISTLEEVRAVWSARTPVEAQVTLKEEPMPDQVAAARRPVAVAASITDEDIRRAWYESLSPTDFDWMWIREVQLDPLAIVAVDDRDGRAWRYLVTVSGNDITFATGEPGAWEFVAAPAAGATTSASRAGAESIVFASRDESRKGVAGMDPVELRKSVGLAETATDEEVMAKVSELAARPDPTASGTGDQPPATGTPAPTGTTGTPAAPAADATTAPLAPPPGFTLIADANLEELRQGASAGIAASATLAKQAEDAFIRRHRPRIGPESNPAAKQTEAHLRREWQRNQGEAEAFASILPQRMPTVAAGHEGGADTLEDPAGAWSPAELAAFPELRHQGGN